MLILLQAVLALTTPLYFMESNAQKRPIPCSQAWHRNCYGTHDRLSLLISMIDRFKDVWFAPSWTGVIEGEFNLHAIIVLLGGGFIIYTATKETFT